MPSLSGLLMSGSSCGPSASATSLGDPRQGSDHEPHDRQPNPAASGTRSTWARGPPTTRSPPIGCSDIPAAPWVTGTRLLTGHNRSPATVSARGPGSPIDSVSCYGGHDPVLPIRCGAIAGAYHRWVEIFTGGIKVWASAESFSPGRMSFTSTWKIDPDREPHERNAVTLGVPDLLAELRRRRCHLAGRETGEKGARPTPFVSPLEDAQPRTARSCLPLRPSRH